jgi:demethylmacrocin O-methyltransferase
VSEEIGGIDIVVDDGSHVNSHVITSFKTLFPLLRKGGCYVVEDIHTSYDQYYDGDCVNLNNTNTSMGFFKQILDAINYEKIEDECEEFKSVMNNVRSIHFYKNLIFILKK